MTTLTPTRRLLPLDLIAKLCHRSARTLHLYKSRGLIPGWVSSQSMGPHHGRVVLYAADEVLRAVEKIDVAFAAGISIEAQAKAPTWHHQGPPPNESLITLKKAVADSFDGTGEDRREFQQAAAFAVRRGYFEGKLYDFPWTVKFSDADGVVFHLQADGEKVLRELLKDMFTAFTRGGVNAAVMLAYFHRELQEANVAGASLPPEDTVPEEAIAANHQQREDYLKQCEELLSIRTHLLTHGSVLSKRG